MGQGTVKGKTRGIPQVLCVLRTPAVLVPTMKWTLLMYSTVSGVSSQNTLSTSSMNSSISSDSVWAGTTSDRFVQIIVILLIVFCHDLLKTNLCYIVLILGLLIFTVAAAAAAAAVLLEHGSQLQEGVSSAFPCMVMEEVHCPVGAEGSQEGFPIRVCLLVNNRDVSYNFYDVNLTYHFGF